MRFTKVQFAIFLVGLWIILAYCVPWKFTIESGRHISMGFHSLTWFSYDWDWTTKDFVTNIEGDPAGSRPISINIELLTLILVMWVSVFYVFAKTNWGTQKMSQHK